MILLKRAIQVILVTILLLPGLVAAQNTAGMPSRSDLSAYLGVINDNYTGTIERGEKGLYVGPDDFLTVSILLRVHWTDWRWAITYNNFTSRKFLYRYDLIFAGVSKSLDLSGFRIRPELGVVWKGDCGGDELQNGYHRRNGFPELILPYCEGGTGAYLSVVASHEMSRKMLLDGRLTPGIELRLISDHVPSRVNPMLSYQTDLWQDRIRFEALVGGRFYLNEVPEYSRLVRSGPFFGIDLKGRVYRDLFFNYGMTFFPAKNLENDPIYKDKPHHYVPQITIVFGWNDTRGGMYNYLDY